MELTLPSVGRTLQALVGLLVFDAMYFSLIARHMYPNLNVKIAYGLIAWLALAFAIASLKTREDAFLYGLAVGAVTYGVFNGTELAIRPDWRSHWSYSVLDMSWGMIVCGSVSWLINHKY